MRSNTVLKDDGMRILAEQLGIVEAERFIALMRRDRLIIRSGDKGFTGMFR